MRPERRFWFMLAGHLGMSVREAQERISASEFSEWIAYYNIQPFGDRMHTQLSAFQCYWSYVAMNGSNGVKPQDFDIASDDSNKAKTVDDKMSLLMAVSNIKR